jgi:hypothetical protein
MPIGSHLPQADPFSLVPTFNPLKGVLLLQVSDIPGVVHMVEYHDMGDSIWIVLERGDHTKVTNIFKKSKKNFKINIS